MGQSVELALSALLALFWLLARVLTIFDKKYSILTWCEIKELFLIVLQQNNVNACSLWLLLALSLSLYVSLWLSMALCDFHSGSHLLSLSLFGLL